MERLVPLAYAAFLGVARHAMEHLSGSLVLGLLGIALMVLGQRFHGRAVKASRRPPRLATVAIALGAFAAGAGLIDAAAKHFAGRGDSASTEFWDGTRFQERVIYNACQAYQSIRGRWPATLEELVPDFLDDRRSLADPQHRDVGEIGYQYFASDSTGQEPESAVFLASKAEHDGKRAVIFFGGKSGFVPATELPKVP